ncbi:MAG: sigma-70 family RNA polymerase sigma factor [Deltaproteobacteria bacterium]|nr:sigma-70 family RNA polymerase sigma factor [Deltaproteobacteria bacterium]
MASEPRKTADKDRAAALASATAAGDSRAREQLARWCLPRVRRTVALAYGRGGEAEDLVQIAMSKAFQKIGSYRGEASFFVWVDRITVNTVRDHQRRRQLLSYFGEPGPELRNAESVDRPDRELDRQRLLERLSGHFAAIKPIHRMPLVLSMLHGYTVPEIAAMLDIRFEAAKKRLQRGRRELLARVRKDPRCREALLEMAR